MTDWILRLLCRNPGVETAPTLETPADPLASLRKSFPRWLAQIPGSRIIDFGSGWGFQSAALARLGAKEVLALELGEEKRAFTEKLGLPNLRVRARPDPSDEAAFDFVLSLDAFEHYGDPAAILASIFWLLRPGGRMLMSFGPPWFSPYGSHLRFMCSCPWVHLLFSEESLMRARARFRSDGARRFSDIEGGLNKMSVGRFERLLNQTGFRIERRRYRCRIGPLALIPVLRELFISEVVVVARKN
jgi:SAM-dependent methyltransferase